VRLSWKFTFVVTSYVSEGDQDLAEEIRKVVEDESKSFDQIFSRNKMLRRKINRRKMAIAKSNSSGEEGSKDAGEIYLQEEDSQDACNLETARVDAVSVTLQN